MATNNIDGQLLTDLVRKYKVELLPNPMDRWDNFVHLTYPCIILFRSSVFLKPLFVLGNKLEYGSFANTYLLDRTFIVFGDNAHTHKFTTLSPFNTHTHTWVRYGTVLTFSKYCSSLLGTIFCREKMSRVITFFLRCSDGFGWGVSLQRS